jgi:hypothetical protein
MELHDPHYATYLPAVPSLYLSAVAKKLPKGRRFPKGITPADLVFWEKNNLWHYPFFLHSIGQYAVGTKPHDLMDKVNRPTSTLIGDSGGYQIGKGTLSGLQHIKRGPMNALDAVAAWRKERHARNWIKDWLSSQCDYGMTIDMPLWATAAVGKRSPFHLCTSKQLTEMTNQNLRVINEFSPKESKWLNVIQGGEHYPEAIDWFRTVKWFQRGGWALAGSAGARGGLANLMVTILMMRDEGAFSEGQDWLHVLGVSTPFWAIALTTIQGELRRLNPSLRVSYDSSSPFVVAGKFEEVCLRPDYTDNKASWSIKSVRADQRPSFAKDTCTREFPYKESPIGQKLMLNHLNVREGAWEPRQFDTLSNALLMNHNTWVYLDAMKRANDLVASGEKVPSEYHQCIEIIKHLFSYASAFDATYEIEKHLRLFDRVAPQQI